MKTNRNLIWVALALLLLLAVLLPKPTEEILPKRAAASMGNIKCTVAKFLLGPIDSTRQIAPLFENLGNHHFEVTTQNARSQAFFDQGIRLTYAFNHAEGHRAFLEAGRLDPRNPMAFWGQAYALGPNINDPEPVAERRQQAWDALQKANALLDRATPLEQALILALNARYSPDPEVPTATLNEAYRQAMGGVASEFPDHPEVLTLYAASILNTMPWNYWKPSGAPMPHTLEAQKALERTIALSPDHPGAHHYYIHLVELPFPDLGVPSAERLEDLMPAAGHLVHMPSHIYIRVGRYKDAVRVNRKAIGADEDYIAQCFAQGLYPLTYYPHNIHFLWSASSLIGESETAIWAARKTAEKVPVGEMTTLPFLQDFASTPLLAYIRFGKWNDILTFPEPAKEVKHLRLMRHYARGMAFIRKGKPGEAREELEAIAGLIEDPEMMAFIATPYNPSERLARVAHGVVAGELAALEGRGEEAIQHLQEAIAAEDALTYTEPSAWHIPPRQNLGAVLMDLGKFAEAEAVYREDLKRLRKNGWSLKGLQLALEAQGKTDEALQAAAAFRDIWKHADLNIQRSVL
ncbi:hypothetical protein OZ410_09560 [Robiginitalea sp. M366]|uniref:tetratricopeptide repeat protein n=1 Tax=Robiginitalea aestuariiviva TaxID=3036903 RepID=UPI00240E3FF1|nr:hypothetical protein [Robiginitalea aestuariiviva]MDG1572562.1 hypothetical protein [Robiginitalea aestuariiviva]